MQTTKQPSGATNSLASTRHAQWNVALPSSIVGLRDLAFVAIAAWAIVPSQALAQRADENVVLSAQDAFGTSIGLESIGLYDETSVRGFSPTVAGNARVEGLYFDQQAPINIRVRSESTIHVGIAAQGYPFPSPTGIVDITLRPSGETPVLSAVVGYGPFGGQSVQLDGQLPLDGKHLSTAAGMSVFRENLGTGGSDVVSSIGFVPRWHPADNVAFTMFWGRVYISDQTAAPIYTTAGAYLPPKIKRGQYAGPSWDLLNGFTDNAGLIGTADIDHWTVQAGLFNSLFRTDSSYANLLADIAPDGQATRILIADPPQRSASTSGELRISRVFERWRLQHELLGTIRWRSVATRYGGSQLLDEGAVSVNVPLTASPPDLQFSAQTRDHVDQRTAGFSYRLSVGKSGEMGVGLQKTEYRRTENRPNALAVELKSTPWLPYVTLAFNVAPTIATYASYTRGLEDSGNAPDTAANRAQPLPAVRTEQHDAGFKWTPTEKMKLIVGYFSIEKPYLTIDRLNAYRALGTETHVGIEVSLSATPVDGFTVVAGAIVSAPRVSNVADAQESIARLPVGQPSRVAQLNVDYQLPALPAVSLNLGVNYIGAQTGTDDNSVRSGAYSTVAVGGRYKFRIGDKPYTFRVSVNNALNEFAWTVLSSGAYQPLEQRSFSGFLTVDF